MLPRRAKVRAVEHHAALDWREVGSFVMRLREQPGVAARALEWTILAAARTSETLGARWSEVELSASVSTAPPKQMKAGREHRVPLSVAAIALLGTVADYRLTIDASEYVFPSATTTRPLSNMTMAAVLRRMGYEELTVHGMRSTFRDWAAEATGFPGDVVEAALAHTVSNKVEAAYRRGDLFEKRRELMEAWGRFCGELYVRPEGRVLPLKATA